MDVVFNEQLVKTIKEFVELSLTDLLPCRNLSGLLQLLTLDLCFLQFPRMLIQNFCALLLILMLLPGRLQ